MELEVVLFPARHDEGSKELRVSKQLWNAALKAVHGLGGNPFEERFAPEQARRFASLLSQALGKKMETAARVNAAEFTMRPAPTPSDVLTQEGSRATLAAILKLFDSGTGVVVEQRLPSSTRAI